MYEFVYFPVKKIILEVGQSFRDRSKCLSLRTKHGVGGGELRPIDLVRSDDNTSFAS